MIYSNKNNSLKIKLPVSALVHWDKQNTFSNSVPWYRRPFSLTCTLWSAYNWKTWKKCLFSSRDQPNKIFKYHLSFHNQNTHNMFLKNSWVKSETYFKTILKSTAVVRMTKLENNTAIAWEQKEQQQLSTFKASNVQDILLMPVWYEKLKSTNWKMRFGC